MTKQRVHKTLQQLPATSHERLPILFDLNKHPLKDLSPNKMYIRLNRQPNAILIVEFHEKINNKCEIGHSYYCLWVKPASLEDDPKDDLVQPDIPKVYLIVRKVFTGTDFEYSKSSIIRPCLVIYNSFKVPLVLYFKETF